MNDYDFTLAGFRAWAEDHDPNEVAGYTCTDKRCPVRNFWDACFDHPDPDGSYWMVSFICEREDTPWVETAARTLDAQYGEPTGPSGLIQPVTFTQVLDVLATISTDEHSVNISSLSTETPAML